MASFRSLRRSSAAFVAVGALTFGAAACADDGGNTEDPAVEEPATDEAVDGGALDDGMEEDPAMDDGAAEEDA